MTYILIFINNLSLLLYFVFCSQMQQITQNKVVSYRRISMLAASTIVLTLAGCYFLSEMRKHDYVKIFPREAVTNSAKGYPESILFKVGMGLTTSPLLLLTFILGEWLRYWLGKTSLKCYSRFITVINVVALTGILGQNLTVFSIDRNGTWLQHRYSAFYFYLIVYPYLGFYMWVVSRIRKIHPQCMGNFSYAFKVVLIWFLFLITAMMVISMIWLDAKQRVPVSIVQWKTLFLLCLFFISHVDDKPHIFITFDQDSMCLQFCLYEPAEWKSEMKEQPSQMVVNCS